MVKDCKIWVQQQRFKGLPGLVKGFAEHEVVIAAFEEQTHVFTANEDNLMQERSVRSSSVR
jgi:hypothetical protein